MSKAIDRKIQEEMRTVSFMIRLYCCKHHSESPPLCPACAHLEQYAKTRIDQCPFGETKSFCSLCSVHCYSPDMRRQIRSVMRFSGPRMLFFHPVMALRHLFYTLRHNMH